MLPLALAEACFPPFCLGRPGQAPITGGAPVVETSRQQAGAGKSGSKFRWQAQIEDLRAEFELTPSRDG